MNRHFGTGLEAQLDGAAANVKHRDFEQLLKTAGPADHYRFLTLPGQNQHD
jgi:hypothetical protein